jgi:translation elongation factor EF-Ts
MKTGNLTLQEKNLCFKLRSETGLGIMACKRCLIEYDWNYDEAKHNHKRFRWDGALRL